LYVRTVVYVAAVVEALYAVWSTVVHTVHAPAVMIPTVYVMGDVL
jgi:hypothetical protein